MKRVAIFIGLKTVEIAALVGVYWVLYSVSAVAFPLREPEPWFVKYVAAPLTIAVAAAACFLLAALVIAGITEAIVTNWQWAGRLARRKK